MIDFPEEILASIIWYCDDSYGDAAWEARKRYKSDREGFRVWLRTLQATLPILRALCLVSKAFRRASQPLLFRRFYRELGPGDAGKRTRLFLRTLLENHELGNQVDEVALGAWDDARHYVSVPPPKDLAALYREDLLPLLSMESKSGMYTALCKGSQDAEIALLLALCPNVRALDFTSSSDLNRKSWLEQVLRQQRNRRYQQDWSSTAKSQRILDRLQHLALEYVDFAYLGLDLDDPDHHGPEHYGSLDQARPFFQLCQLKHLEAGMVRLAGSHDLPQTIICGLLHIHLHDCLWTVQGVSALLQVCTGLETLELIAAYDSHPMSLCEVNFPALGDALRQYGTSLRSLSIDARSARDYGRDYENYQPLIGSLKPLRQLRHLQMPFAQLLDEDEHGAESNTYDEAECVASQRVVHVYSELRQHTLPRSIVYVLILDCWVVRNRGADECIIYTGFDEGEGMTMHLCRETGHSPYNICTAMDWNLGVEA